MDRTVVMVTHDPVAAAHADEVVFLADGRLVDRMESPTADKVLDLAVLIALLGIANTLTLAVHERTRELGLLRAVGQTRAQLRAMVRWESVLVAAFGTTGGLALGAFLGWLLVRSSDSASDTAFTFAIPLAQLLVVAVVGSAAGALAGLCPARRAARLDALRAIATE